VKRGKWVDNKRVGDWLQITDEEKKTFIDSKNVAVSKATEVDYKRKLAA
jgi:hypothetical protein